MKIRLGTRGSPLALVQTQLAAGELLKRSAAIQVEVVVIRTEGDRNRQDSLTALGGRGVFVRDIEERLLAGEIDAAVHSLKDLPSAQPDGLCLAAIPERSDPYDVMVARGPFTLASLAHGARVGSSSQRRAAQLLALRPDVQIADIRGNVDTRLRKLDEGQYDAIVLAAAGLVRMGLGARIAHRFTPEEMLPAVGQGALAIECRADDAGTRELLAPLDDRCTRSAVNAERAFLRGLGGGCQLPIGALATIEGGMVRLAGMVAKVDGTRIVRSAIEGPVEQAEALGAELAKRVLELGAREIMAGQGA